MDRLWDIISETRKDFLTSKIENANMGKKLPSFRRTLFEEKMFEKMVSSLQELEDTFSKPNPFYVVLDGVMYANNIGPIIRAACQMIPDHRHLVVVVCGPSDDQMFSMGVKGVNYDNMFTPHYYDTVNSISDGTSVGYSNQKIRTIVKKSSAYAVNSDNITIIYNTPISFINGLLESNNKRVIVAENDVYEVGAIPMTPTKCDALIFGSESVGVSESTSSYCIFDIFDAKFIEVPSSRVPKRHEHASLNVFHSSILMMSKLEWTS